MSVELRPAWSDADLVAWAALRNAVTPGHAVAVERLRRDAETLRLLASVDGSVAGCGLAARSAIRDAAFVAGWVLPGARRRGAGSALLAVLSDHARSLGATVLRARTVEDQADALAFLAHRGFFEVTREFESRLDVLGDVPAIVVPEGVEIVTLASRTDLAPQAHALAIEGFADIPTAEDVVVPPFDEWRRENVDEALVEGSFLAVADDRVVGSAGLTARPGEPGAAEHLLTAVARAWRRRGVARALKTAQIEWARRSGYRELVTFNDAANVPMRRLNEALGYVSRPAEITLHRPVG